MHTLQIGFNWSAQIGAIRNANTEDTNLVRFGNNFYRCCRSGLPEFEVLLSAGVGGTKHPIRLTMSTNDLYVSSIAGQRMGRYASTSSELVASAGKLNSAIHDLAAGVVHGDKGFEQRSLLVFCVAESIRNDHFATALEQTLQASHIQIKGIEASLRLQPWWTLAHQWGQASDAIYACLSDDARKIIGRPRATLTPKERQFSEYVNPHKLPPHLQRCAQTLRVLKRPA